MPRSPASYAEPSRSLGTLILEQGADETIGWRDMAVMMALKVNNMLSSLPPS